MIITTIIEIMMIMKMRVLRIMLKNASHDNGDSETVLMKDLRLVG